MAGTDKVTVGRALPKIADVTPSAPYNVTVTWADGSRNGRTETIDLAPMILTFKMYWCLRDDPTAFSQVRVSAFGYALAWDDDETIDMSSVAIEELAEQTMEARDFKAFMVRHGLTLDTAAAQLGLGRRIVAYYSSGKKKIPRVVSLACSYFDAAPKRREIETT